MPKHWQTALFEKFKATYRNKFMAKFANEDEYNETMQEWGYALVDLSSAEIARGIELSIKTLAWPPEIAEFIKLAKSRDDLQHRGNAYRVFKRGLPKPVDRELARLAIAGLKAVL